MNWNWRMETSGGDVVEETPITPPAQGFPNQGEAETWLGEVWRELLANGVDAVTLLEEGREVYGPMSLHPVT